MYRNFCRKVRPAVAEAVERRLLMAAGPSLAGTFTSQPAPPATMAGGEFATASYTVRNTGTAASSNFVPIFMLEKDTPTPGGGGDISLAEVASTGTSDSTSTLAAGKTATETLEFVLPQGLSGTYYLVGEFSLTNFFASPAIDLNGSTPILSASFTSSSVPATAAFGSTITPQVQITNTGTAEAAGQELTNYYLSTSNDPNQALTGTAASGVYFLGSSKEALDLQASQVMTESPAFTLPNTASLAPGTYYLVAQANQGTPPIAGPFSNNPVAVSAGIAITAAEAGASSPVVPSLSNTKLPASLLSGMRTPTLARVTLTNSGSSVASGSTTVTLFLSTSPTLDSSATPVTAVTRKLRIPAGRSTSLAVPLKAIPAGMTNGSYYLLARVTDASGATNSAATSGTVSVATPFVALDASLATPTANVLKTGTTLLLQNAGNISETTTIDYTVGFSSDAQGQMDVGSQLPQHFAGRVTLRPGATVRLHVTGWSKIVSGLAAGQYYLTVFVEDASMNTSLGVSPTQVTVG
ncbi:MAG TPA: hypothetical protein VGI81_16875 [Tepidisphaeraceae bacterium]|jgi:hypothetical protein